MCKMCPNLEIIVINIIQVTKTIRLAFRVNSGASRSKAVLGRFDLNANDNKVAC